MAMPGLILKSVLWGVDRVPEHWFEKIPGGYYSPKDENPRRDQKGNGNGNSRDSHKGRGSTSSSRRHSTDSDTRGQRRNERRRQDSASRRNEYRRADRSCDGNADERRSRSHGDGGEDRERERRRTTEPRNRRRSPDNDARLTGSRDDNYRQSYQPRRSDPVNTRSLSIPPQGTQTPVFAQNRMSMQEQRPGAHGSIGSSYVPYADIYGPPPPNNSWPPPPPPIHQDSPSVTSSRSEPQRKAMTPVMPPPGHYRQNPYAQQPPNMPTSGINDAYTTVDTSSYPPVVPTPHEPRRVDSRYDDPYGSQASYSSHADRRDSKHTPLYNSISEFISPVKRQPSQVPSEHRSHNSRHNVDSSTTEGDGKAKSRVQDAFDTSQRGLGYGAIGAITGGLLGSEVSKSNSVLPIAIGATIGALGANAFQGHDRRREAREHDPYRYNEERGLKPTHEGYHSDQQSVRR